MNWEPDWKLSHLDDEGFAVFKGGDHPGHAIPRKPLALDPEKIQQAQAGRDAVVALIGD